MAKKEEKTKIVLERTYNVPLRKEFLKTPNWKRTKKAVKALKEFLVRHMKPLDMDIKNVKIGKHLNEHIWKDGIRNPPHHVKVVATKDDKGLVKAELEGAPVDVVKEEPKKSKLSSKLDKKSSEVVVEDKKADFSEPVKDESSVVLKEDSSITPVDSSVSNEEKVNPDNPPVSEKSVDDSSLKK